MSTNTGEDEASGSVASASVASAVSGGIFEQDNLTNTPRKPRSRSSSLRMSRDEGSVSSLTGVGGDPSDDTDLNLPPGRMNAVKGHHRLQGSGSNLMTLLHARTTGTETPRSRSRSPSLRDKAGIAGGYSTSITHDGNSSISSCDDMAPDNDILTDRAGFVDELADNIRRMHNSREMLNLPSTVNERMTEESLDDCHAFSDCQVRVRSSNASLVSGVSSVANEASVLEPCLEGEEDESDYSDNEEDEDDEDNDTGGDDVATGKERKHRKKGSGNINHPTVILTNMENLTLHHQQILEEEDEFDDGIDEHGERGDDDTDAAIIRTVSSTDGVQEELPSTL